MFQNKSLQPSLRQSDPFSLSQEIAALRSQLLSGLSVLGLDLASEKIDLILGYVGLLHKWGAVYNLTAIKAPEDILIQHVLDCLSIVNPLLSRVTGLSSVLDVGAGAGLPSVMIAIACPQVKVVAIDAVAKKIAFINQVALQLGLQNLSAQHQRIESVLSAQYDVVISRAFASLKDFIEGTRGAIRIGGVWLAMKGRIPSGEIESLPAGFMVTDILPLKVPGLNAERCLVCIAKANGS